ncbi:MAG: hypothetical protein JW982_11270 [Spirochaetes bacterium]|nr:hypothetical protein [Spirochaetota bacterium]
MNRTALKFSRLLPALYLLPAACAVLFTAAEFFEIDSFSALLNSDTLFIIRSTLIQSSLSTLLCFMISIGPVIFISRNRQDNFLSNIIRITFFIPYYYPVVSTIISFSIIFSGYFLKFQYSLFSIVTAHVFYNSPVMVKYLSESIVKIKREIHESAVLETRSYFSIFRHISMPLIIKSFSRAFFIVFSFCFTSFGVILALGNIRYSNLEISIFTSLNTNLDFSSALGYGFIQFAVLAIINFFASRTGSPELLIENYPSSNTWNLKETFFSVLYAAFEFLIVSLPLICFFAFTHEKKTNYMKIIFSEKFNTDFPVIRSIMNSFVLSSLSALSVTFITYILLKKNSKSGEMIITSAIGISTALLSISFLYVSIIFGINPYLIMLAGFMTLSIPYSYSLMHQHVTGFNRSMLEAALLETKSSLKRFFSIELPVIYPVLILNFLNVFAIIYGEFTFAYIFNSGNSLPLVSTTGYSIASRRLLGETYALNTFNSFFIIMIFGLIFFISSKLKTGRSK